MDCEEKDTLLIFLLVLTGLETALLAAILFLFCRFKVRIHLQSVLIIYIYNYIEV